MAWAASIIEKQRHNFFNSAGDVSGGEKQRHNSQVNGESSFQRNLTLLILFRIQWLGGVAGNFSLNVYEVSRN